MVRGLDLFKTHFADCHRAFVLIGGVACDEWFTARGLRFRATKDIDMVLIVEALDASFARRFWDFVRAGGYETRQKSSGTRVYYRFSEPANGVYPLTLELFSRCPPSVDLGVGQAIVPLPAPEGASSLSAILMDSDYYDLVLKARDTQRGLPILRPEALIALKARAWLDLHHRRESGERIDRKDIDKHRNDVFRLAHILGAGQSWGLPDAIHEDFTRFLNCFPPESDDWSGITSSVRNSVPEPLPPARLLQRLREYFPQA